MILILSLITTLYLIKIEKTTFSKNADCLVKNADISKSKVIKFQVSGRIVCSRHKSNTPPRLTIKDQLYKMTSKK